MVFLETLESMSSIALLMALGFVLARKGMIPAKVEAFLPGFILKVAVPPFLAGAMVEHLDRASFLRDLPLCLVPMAAMAAAFLAFLAVGRLAGIDPGHRRVAAACATVSNAIFIGLPVNQALFGHAGLQPFLHFYLASGIFFFTVGNWAISRDGTKGRGAGLAAAAKNLLPPPFVGMLAGIVLLLAGIPLPDFVTRTCSMLGGLGMPLSLIYIGVLMHEADWRAARLEKDVALALAGRLVLAPLVMAALALLLPADIAPLSARVYVVQAGIPMMTAIPLLCAVHGADGKFAAAVAGLSVIFSMATVPLWMAALSLFL